jgi:hypothetical protein
MQTAWAAPKEVGLPSRICQVETAGAADFLFTLFYTHAKHNELPSGWPVLFAAYEVVCTSVLRHPAYVRHITHKSFFLSADTSNGRTTLAAVILNHIGLYCETSWSPAWGHVYVRDVSWLFPFY